MERGEGEEGERENGRGEREDRLHACINSQ